MQNLAAHSSASSHQLPRGEIVPLEWDTRHFGFPVARIEPPEADAETVSALLADARRLGIEMLVWAAAADRDVSAVVLGDYSGALVDRRATFVADLTSESSGAQTAPSGAGPRRGVHVSAYTGETASDDLLTLSVAAGVHSRFNVDPRFPRDKFEELYRNWIERCVQHERADEVLVAHDPAALHAALLGMVTVSARDGVGTIGLIAVAEAARGRGIGRLLIGAAHAWMRDRGALRARVGTQSANLPACRLYERLGYQLSKIERFYHFWPQARQ